MLEGVGVRTTRSLLSPVLSVLLPGARVRVNDRGSAVLRVSQRRVDPAAVSDRGGLRAKG